MVRFFLALWAAKLYNFILSLKGRKRDDRPGRLARKLCPDFLARISKPGLVIAVTGTNGKTTTSAFINRVLKDEGYSVTFNDWGANLHAGYCLNLLRSVDIFNRPSVDISLLEADEKTLPFTMKMIRPEYILVTNISRDTMRRNGHTEYIAGCIEKTMEILGEDVTAVLNGNDPISSQLGRSCGARRVFYGMGDTGEVPFENLAKDIEICPYCGGRILYRYRHYRQIGDFYCEDCGFKTEESSYYADMVDLKGRKIVIREDRGCYEYPLLSDTVYNAMNILSAAALLREIGIKPSRISESLKKQTITKIRETCIEYNGIEYYTYGTKAQTPSATSAVFEYMAKEPSIKELVLCLDDVHDKNHPAETTTWLYEADYEYLNTPNIRKIICAGDMYLHHRIRLLLAGIPEERIFCMKDEEDVSLYVDTEGIEKVYVLFEIEHVSKAERWRSSIIEKAMEAGKGECHG